MLKRTISLLLCLCMVLAFIPLQASAAESIAIDQTNFPDENFRTYLLEQNYGTGGVLTPEEIAGITELDVSKLEIKDLTGVEYFTALTDLDCYNNDLTALDVSHNTALTNLDCGFNNITELDLSKNTALVELNCFANDLTELDVSNNLALEDLRCGANELTELDVTKNLALTDLACGDNDLTELDVTKNTKLKHFWCYGNQLAAIELSKNTALLLLECENNRLTELDISNNPDMYMLLVSENQLTSLDLSKNPLLTDIECSDNLYVLDLGEDKQLDLTMLPGKFDVTKASNWVGGTVEGNVLTFTDKSVTYDYQITDNCMVNFKIVTGKSVEINATNFPDVNFRTYLLEQNYGADGVLDTTELRTIEELDVSELEIQDLTGVEHFGNLKYLYCYDNNLSKLDVSKNTALEGLSCEYNRLTALDVSKNTALESLSCEYNRLTALDVSKNTALESLSCYNNRLTVLDVSKNTELYSLYCYENQLTALDLSKNTALEHLDCDDNQLTKLDLTLNTKLTYIRCVRNQLTKLDVSKNTELTNLSCYENQLTELDLTNNTALEYLNCDDNQLTKLDVSKNIALESLNCCYNMLTELDVSKNSALENLNCSHNCLVGLDISNNPLLSDFACYENEHYVTLDSNRQLDLTTLPESFDITKVIAWSEDLDGTTLTFHSHSVDYIYDIGNGNEEMFTLTSDEGCVDADDDWVCDICESTLITRLSGVSRHETALEIADAMCDGGQFETIIIASGSNFADALAGSYLASVKDAPILMSSNVPAKRAKIIAYINENLAPDGTVYILGGTAAVPAVYTIGACDLDDTYILPSSGIIPVILASRVKLRQITMTLDFEGESAHDVALAISKMTAMFSGEVHLLLPDGFYYWCAYEKASTPTEKAPWIRQVKFTFSGFRHGRKQTFTLAENSTVFIDGNVETPLIVKITPVAGTTEAVFNGVKVTELSGSVTIDGVYTTILDADGMNKFKDTDMTEWPKLKPGFAEIAVEGAATFEVSYYPIWL